MKYIAALRRVSTVIDTIYERQSRFARFGVYVATNAQTRRAGVSSRHRRGIYREKTL
jgi:hypothetical protein